MTKSQSTQAVYDRQAHRWARHEKLLLSDFTARPRVLEALGPLGGAHVLDLGCGEGYVSRLMAERGAASIFGIDLSPEMIHHARAAIPKQSLCEMTFETGDASSMTRLPRQHFDRVVAVFLFNYITRTQMVEVLSNARRWLSPRGRFVFTVPHPCLPYMRSAEAPFYFDPGERSYFDGVDDQYEGRMWRRDGTDVRVRCSHKTLGDYFDALHAAGWQKLPEVKELGVTPEHIELDPGFFRPLEGCPLHMLFSLEAEL